MESIIIYILIGIGIYYLFTIASKSYNGQSFTRKVFSSIKKSYNAEDLTPDEEYTFRKNIELKSVDEILEKINKKGINSLTKKEKEILDKFSNK